MKTWIKLKNNPSLWPKYFVREKIIHAIREFFLKQDFHEVETPLLLSAVIPESHLEVFHTFLLNKKNRKKKMFLATSPEASIKKLLVAGVGNCFEITKSFRNTEIDSLLHSPEFTILEWYRVKATYEDIMIDCENLITYIYKKLKSGKVGFKFGNEKIVYQKQQVDLSPPWEKLSMDKALQKYAGFSLKDLTKELEKDNRNRSFYPREKIANIAKKKGYKVFSKNTWEELFNQIYLNEVEPHLGTNGKPTFIYDFPKPLAALARLKKTDPKVAERFELYIGGLELADCYTELTNYKEYQRRFEVELKKRKQKRKINVKVDLDFLKTLKLGLPQCAGIAFGLDRLIMLFTNASSIKEILLFPS